jgi:transposase
MMAAVTWSGAGVKLLSFNAYQLRMIASSRKKTDMRDSYWLAKALQTGMTPHPVYIPTGTVRLLRSLLSQRQALLVERRRWLARARAHLQAAGYKTKITRSVTRLLETAVANPDGLDEYLAQALELCIRMEQSAEKELRGVEERLFKLGKPIDAIERLMTIPGIGNLTAVMIYAWVGDISRFRNARQLTSYAGLVPSTHQSGEVLLSGRITKEGAGQLRSCLVQCGHVLLSRCQTKEAQPLKALAERVHTTRARRKIAVVAAARHILRIAYYVLRDGSVYEPDRLRGFRGGLNAAEQSLPEAVTSKVEGNQVVIALGSPLAVKSSLRLAGSSSRTKTCADTPRSGRARMEGWETLVFGISENLGLSVPACGCFKHSRPLASCLRIDVLAEVRPEPLTAIMEGQSNWQKRRAANMEPWAGSAVGDVVPRTSGPGVPLEMSCRELRAPACPIVPRRTLRGGTGTQEDGPVHPGLELEHETGSPRRFGRPIL